MINPKYDPSNYTKHSPIIIIADYQQIDKLFRSYLLLIKWKVHGTSKALDSASNVGIIRQLVETPLGKEVPKDFQLQVSKVNEVYTQFLSISSDWEYQLSILNPVGIAKTSIEIWEYHEPQTYLNPSMPFFPEGTSTPAPADPALLAAVAANAAATAGLVTAMNAQPAAIANAVNNDTSKTLPPEQFLVDVVPVLVLAKNNLTRGANISNQGNNKIKLWCSDDPIAPGTSYNSTGYLFHMEGKGSYEIPEPFYKSNVWAVANNAGGQISTTRSIDI
jgi:hypothetical protein